MVRESSRDVIGDGPLADAVAAGLRRTAAPVDGGPTPTTPLVVVDASADVAAVAAHAVAEGRDVVAAVVAPELVDALVRRWDGPARVAGVRLAIASGWAPGLGDLLGAVAVDALPQPVTLDVAYAAVDRSGTRSTLRGLRAAPGLAPLLQVPLGPARTLVGGRPRDEPVAATRRLAWFPRPVGPHHAATVPGAEVVTIPLHRPGVEDLRVLLAIRSWQAEVLQALTRRNRWVPGARDGPGPSRFACLAEGRGADGTIVRAWAYGSDLVRAHGALLLLAASRLGGAGDDPGTVPHGVVSPAMLGAPTDLLDRLADDAVLRWQVRRGDAREA